MTNPLTPAGIEPATFRFVARHLNHCATAVPYGDKGSEFSVVHIASMFRKLTSNSLTGVNVAFS